MYTKEQKWLFDHTMELLDGLYDETEALVHCEKRGTACDVRDSAHYALGLFERGDVEKGCRVLERILSLQFDASPEEVYYGTFKRTQIEKDAPHELFPGKHFDAWARYDLDVWQEKIAITLHNRLVEEGFTPEQHKRIAGALRDSILAHVPAVWECYDPNWREFIGTTVSLILARHADKLPDELHERVKAAMTRAVEGSIVRRKRNIHPMNTNVELMHIYICDFYGAYLQRRDIADYALQAMDAFMIDFGEFGTVAEFNSPTYYGVNFITFSIYRSYAPTEFIRACAAKVEEALWREVADNYHPVLGAVCGPYSRSYELDLRVHTSYPALFYVALGAENAPEPADNCESAGHIDLALAQLCVPDEVKEKLLHFCGAHSTRRTYRELIERGAPDANRPWCEATGYLGETYMLGAASGSRNTSGQLRAAIAAWQVPGGETAYMALLRRAPGEGTNHYRTVFLDAKASETQIVADVRVDVARDIEVFFEIDCPGAKIENLAADCFDLPGMRVQVKADAPVELRARGKVLEAVYLSRVTDEKRELHFELTFEPKL